MRIGLSQRVLLHKNRAYDSLDQGWYQYLDGHTLSVIPNTPNLLDFGAIAKELDAFIITGGDDSTIRRVTETKLASNMLSRRKPIIGICHGAFLLTELLGGKLISVEEHSGTEHVVNYFGDLKTVNSFHSWGIVEPPDTANTLVTDLHGHCEAWIDNKAPIAGIVWHPERMQDPWIPEEISNLLNV
jgi:putative glutamine amidotransferase